PFSKSDPAGQVLVADQDVVVFGQEAWWRRCLRVGERTIYNIEQLTATLVVKRSQFRPEAFDDAPQPGQTGPCGDVGNCGGTEALEVAKDQAIRRRADLERTSKPVLGRCPTGLGALTPDAARRHLHDGHQVANRVSKRRCVPVRPPLAQQGAEL